MRRTSLIASPRLRTCAHGSARRSRTSGELQPGWQAWSVPHPSGAFEDETETLKTLRDELRMQLNHAGVESRGALHDVGEAARHLADEIKEAFRRICELL